MACQTPDRGSGAAAAARTRSEFPVIAILTRACIACGAYFLAGASLGLATSAMAASWVREEEKTWRTRDLSGDALAAMASVTIQDAVLEVSNLDHH
jgi:hypothetical protein